jgi:SAM-dependent methyltransferase
MRRVYEDRDLASARGAIAKRDIERNYSPERVSELISQRLAVIVGQGDDVRGGSEVARPVRSADSPLDTLPTVPPLVLDRSSRGPLGIAVKRGVSALLRYHNHYQWEINTSFAAFMRQLHVRLTDQDRRLSVRLTEQERRIAELDTVVARQNWTEAQLEDLERNMAASLEQIEDVQQNMAAASLKQVEDLERNMARSMNRIEGLLASRPYMAQDVYGAMGDLEEPMGYGREAGIDGHTPAVPIEFEDLFRGSREFIRQRQAIYLQFFKGRRDVVDLGCGRGEFLDLLRDEGIEAVGVDLNPRLVDDCRCRGLRAEVADAFVYLKSIPDVSLDAVFSAQFIEHVKPSQLPELLALACAKLRPDGLFIAETVNPESYQALKTFHVDLTHQRPIYPQVLLHMCQKATYSTARIFYPLGGGFIQTNYMQVGEYAVIASR